MQDMKEQWAKNNAQAQLNNTQDKEVIKNTIQKLLLDNLQKEIAIPKTNPTIRDMVAVNEGDKLLTLADWFQSPQFNRFTGGGYTFDPDTKRMVSTGERIARKQEAILQAEQEKAREEQKQQLGLAKDWNKQIGDLEIADRKLTQDADQFAQSLQLQREKLAEDRRHNRAVEANGGIDRPSFSNITTARKEFNSSPQVTYYNEITRRKNDIKAIKSALGSKGRLNATDQALIMNFNKALDPISVVRESEFGRTAAGQSLADKAEGALLKVFRGGSGLSTAEREAVSQVIDIMADEARKTVIPLVQDRVDLARRYNINPSDIVGSEYQKLLNQSANNSQSNSTREMYIQKLKAKGYSDSKINQYLQYKGL